MRLDDRLRIAGNVPGGTIARYDPLAFLDGDAMAVPASLARHPAVTDGNGEAADRGGAASISATSRARSGSRRQRLPAMPAQRGLPGRTGIRRRSSAGSRREPAAALAVPGIEAPTVAAAARARRQGAAE